MIICTSMAAIISFANIDGTVTFCNKTYNANFFLKWHGYTTIFRIQKQLFSLFYKKKKKIDQKICNKLQKMKQEGMTFDHDFCYFILLFSSLLIKEGREKENDVAKIVIKSHTFLFHHCKKVAFYRITSKLSVICIFGV